MSLYKQSESRDLATKYLPQTHDLACSMIMSAALRKHQKESDVASEDEGSF